MKKVTTSQGLVLSLFLWLACLSLPAQASHIVGGELTFHADTTNTSPLLYFFKLVLYQDQSNNNADSPTVILDFGDGTTGEKARKSQSLLDANKTITRNVFYLQHEYAAPGTFFVSFKNINRSRGFLNITNSETIAFFIQATVTIGLQAAGNHSPVFLAPFIPTAVVGQTFRHNVTAYDRDGDSLTYKLVPAMQNTNQPIASYQFPENTTINNRTGEVVWPQPEKLGRYVMAIEIREYRHGQLIGEVMRDFTVTTKASATNPVLQIQNRSELPLNAQNQLFITAIDTPVKIRVAANNAVVLNAYSELFLRKDIITTFPTADSPPTIQYTIRPEILLRRSLPYIITFRGTAPTAEAGTPQQDLTLAVYFRPERATDQQDTTEPGEVPISPKEPEPEPKHWTFKIYPNPVISFFKVDKSKSAPVTFLLYSANSQLVLEQTLTSKQTIIKPSSRLAGGRYFYIILSDQKKIVHTGKLLLL